MIQQFRNNTFETDQVRLIVKIDLCNHLCFHVLIEQWDISFKKCVNWGLLMGRSD